MDDELRIGTEAHYEDALYYDQAYRRRRDDVRFYAALAQEHGGPVLELGCGTGRVTLEIANRGVDIVGVDRMAPMLERARHSLSRKPKRVARHVELLEADLFGLQLDRRFGLIMMPFNVLMHVYTRPELERALEMVRAHLAPNGRFVFDVLVPNAVALARDPNKVYRGGTVRLRGKTYSYRERFSYNPVSQVQIIEMAFVGKDDPADFHLTPLAHRQYFPAELEALLSYNGFEIEARYGDFDRGPLDDESESQVYVVSALPR